MAKTTNNIKRIRTISDDLIRLAEKIVTECENEESVALYGDILDFAYKLKKASEKWSEKYGKDDCEDQQ